MRTVLSLVALLLSAPLTAATPADPLADRLVAAFNAGNTAAIEKDCAPAFWNSPEDSPRWVIEQGYGGPKRAWLFQKGEVELGKNRAAVTIILLNAEKKTPVDALYFYAETRDGAWRWYGVNEDKSFKKAYLAGTIDADFTLEGLPGLPELEDLGPSLSDWFSLVDEDTEDSDLEAPYDGAFRVELSPGGELSARLMYDVDDPEVLETHWSARLNRGLVVLGGAFNEDEGEYEEGMVLYFAKTKEGWSLYNSGYMPDLGSFLEY